MTHIGYYTTLPHSLNTNYLSEKDGENLAFLFNIGSAMLVVFQYYRRWREARRTNRLLLARAVENKIILKELEMERQFLKEAAEQNKKMLDELHAATEQLDSIAAGSSHEAAAIALAKLDLEEACMNFKAIQCAINEASSHGDADTCE